MYERIDARIDQMLADGLIDEVKTLKKMGYHKGMVSMQGLGYKEILSYLDGTVAGRSDLCIKTGTRHFAKAAGSPGLRENVRWNGLTSRILGMMHRGFWKPCLLH